MGKIATRLGVWVPCFVVSHVVLGLFVVYMLLKGLCRRGVADPELLNVRELGLCEYHDEIDEEEEEEDGEEKEVLLELLDTPMGEEKQVPVSLREFV